MEDNGSSISQHKLLIAPAAIRSNLFAAISANSASINNQVVSEETVPGGEITQCNKCHHKISIFPVMEVEVFKGEFTAGKDVCLAVCLPLTESSSLCDRQFYQSVELLEHNAPGSLLVYSLNGPKSTGLTV